MTKNEAIEGLYRILGNYYRVCNEHLLKEIDVAEEINSLNMAIEALEHLDNIEAYMHDFDVTEEEAIKALERNRGEWIYREIFIDENGKGHIGKYFCSVCGSMELHDSNYCPNCGAYNRGEEDEC